MDTADFVYSGSVRMPFDQAVVAVLKAVEKKGWAVFSVYDLSERLAAKGFARPRLKVIEICNARHSDAILGREPLASLCMPCRINVIDGPGGVLVAGMRPSAMPRIFPSVGADIAEAVEMDLVAIIREAIGGHSTT